MTTINKFKTYGALMILILFLKNCFIIGIDTKINNLKNQIEN